MNVYMFVCVGTILTSEMEKKMSFQYFSIGIVREDAQVQDTTFRKNIFTQDVPIASILAKNTRNS